MSRNGRGTASYPGWLPVRHGSSLASGFGIAPVPQYPGKKKQKTKNSSDLRDTEKKNPSFGSNRRKPRRDKLTRPATARPSRRERQRAHECDFGAIFWPLERSDRKKEKKKKKKTTNSRTHIASFVLLPSTVRVLTLKSTPKQREKYQSISIDRPHHKILVSSCDDKNTERI